MFLPIPYEALKLLGWSTVILVLLSLSMHLTITILTLLIKQKPTSSSKKRVIQFLKKILPLLRHYHPVFAFTALITGILHGTHLLRDIRLHSGYVTWFILFTMAFTGACLSRIKKRAHKNLIRKFHKYAMGLLLIVMILHILRMKGLL